MNNEMRVIIKEVLGVDYIMPKSYYKKKKELTTSKFLLYFASIMFLSTWVVAAYSWLTHGTFPNELIRYTSILYGISFGSYCCKTAYEYKADKDCEVSMLKTEQAKFQ